VWSFSDHFQTLFDPSFLKSHPFSDDFSKASLGNVVRVWWPKASQKGANGTTLGAHLQGKGNSENNAPVLAGALF
jgi:hypothetical protein